MWTEPETLCEPEPETLVRIPLRRWPIGRGELHRWVAEEGRTLEAARAAEAEAFLGAHPDRRTRPPRRSGTVWVSADGTMVHDRASGTDFEVKIGLVFDGARRTGRTRRALTDRTLDAGTESWTAFAERFTALCPGLGVYEADRILFVSDGATAIRTDPGTGLPDRHRAARLVPPGRGPPAGDRRPAVRPPGPGPRGRRAGRRRAPRRAPRRLGVRRGRARSRPYRQAGRGQRLRHRQPPRSSTTRSSRWPPRARWRRRSTSSSPAASGRAA